MRLTIARPSPASGSVTACTLALALLGCGPTVSLDVPDTASGTGGTSTGAGPFGPLTADDGDAMPGSLDDGMRLDVDAVKLDVPDLPLPPGWCSPDCPLELDLAWTYDGFSDGSTPLDPRDHVAVVVEADGAVMVAEERQGEITLARLSQFGQEQWTLPLSLPCDPCHLAGLRLLYAGDLLLAGHGLDATGTPVAFAARVAPSGPDIVWSTITPLASGPGIVPRAGSAVVLDDFFFQPVLEAAPDRGVEQLGLLGYDLLGGGIFHEGAVATGLPSGDAPPPLATLDATGALVLTHPAPAGDGSSSGTVRWLSTPGLEELAVGTRVEPSLRLAATPNGSTLTLGVTAGSHQSILYLDSGDAILPGFWQVIHVLANVTRSSPALAVDEHGHSHVLARTAQGSPDRERAVELEVLRWSDDGTLVWAQSLPVALDQVDEPVSLALRRGGALVIGGFVAGARHVEERVPLCVCD